MASITAHKTINAITFITAPAFIWKSSEKNEVKICYDAVQSTLEASEKCTICPGEILPADETIALGGDPIGNMNV